MSVLPPLKPQDSKGILRGSAGAFHIEDIYPIVDSGRFAVKRVAGEPIEVWADIFRDGHDIVAAELIFRLRSAAEMSAAVPNEPASIELSNEPALQRAPMVHNSNDRWSGEFTPTEPGRYVYAIEAWTDEFATWRRGTLLKQEAGQDISLDALEGAAMVTRALPKNRSIGKTLTSACESFLQTGDLMPLLGDEVAAAMSESQSRSDMTRSEWLPLMVDRARAVAGAWYELVPRSQGKVAGKHGTFKDCIARLPDIAAMSFDVLYFTPIHPIGMTNRKGRNNALTAEAGDPGSPYAIGGTDGGHDALHPELGTLEDFRDLVAAAKSKNMEIALDFAVQCSPDHPWLKQHPNWFKRRPDGTIRYAENPPKKYQDIHNPDFHGDDAMAMWDALRDVIWFWVTQGVKIFRVDNPHTKPFPFWEWLIADIQTRDPEVLFLAEAFTRPKLMKGLAKLGFTQSYTYFTWRTEKWELEEYLRELTGYPEREYYRPNFFVSTPDILPVHLQSGEPWMFKSRVALAATLSGTYGIYNGFELLEHQPLPGKEEYLDSEKYEIKVRNWNKPGNIKAYIRDLNKARRASPALQQTARLQFVQIDDANVIGFVKNSADRSDVVATVIALSADTHDIWLPLDGVQVLTASGLKPVEALENIITGERHGVEWGGARLRIDPKREPALLFRCMA